MQFGTSKKAADANEGSGNYLRSFPRGETTVRFLEEPDDWNAYREHYTLEGKSFPCTGNRKACPGCLHPNEKVSKSSRKYATQVYNVKTEKVLPYKIPVTLADRLAVRAERNGGTLLSRDYVILKTGTGLDTEYDVDQEDKYPVDLKELQKKITIEVQDCHIDSFKENWGDWQPPKEEEPRSQRSDDNDPPSEPATKNDAGTQGGDDDDLTDEQVRNMSKKELQALCDRGGVPYTDDDSRSELAERLIKQFGG